MLTLLLLRHAKAAPQAGDDFERPLTEAGRADAARLGAFLRDHDLVPGQALVSPAERTRQTAEAVMAAAGRPVPTRFDPSLYNGTDQQLRDLLPQADGAASILLVVGHNPGIADLALFLDASGDLRDLAAMRSRFPPCSLAVLSFDQDSWGEVRHGGGRLDAFVTPDALADG